MESSRYEAGLRVRKAVLGDDYVDRAISGTTDFTRPFQELVTEFCWGTCWADEALSRKQRSLLNLGMLAALGRMEEFELHFAGAIRNGLSPDELRAALMQISIYCGIPAGVECFRIARRVIAEQDGESAAVT